MTDRKALLKAGWKEAQRMRDGFVTRVFWVDPITGGEFIQAVAVIRQTRRDMESKAGQPNA